MLGDQIYIAALIEQAGHTPQGKTWMLDRMKVMTELGLSDQSFDDVQLEIERRIPGTWDKAIATDRSVYVYMRLR